MGYRIAMMGTISYYVLNTPCVPDTVLSALHKRPNSPNNSVRYVLKGKWGTAVVGTKYSLDNVIPEHILLTTAWQDGRWPPQSLLHWNREDSRPGPEHLGGSHCTTLPSGKGTGGLAERAFPPAEFLLCAILGEAFQNSLPCSKYRTTLA